MKQVANELGLEFVEVDTNVSQIAPMPHIQSHTYRNLSAVYALRRLFRCYLYSTAYDITEFAISSETPSHCESFICPALSVGSLTIYSTFPDANRHEKTDYISGFGIVRKNLNVCTGEIPNCGKCRKCKRTQLSLYALDVLDDFKDVFPVPEFYKNRTMYIGEMLYDKRSDIFCKEIYKAMKAKRKKIPLRSYTVAGKCYIKGILRPVYLLIKCR